MSRWEMYAVDIDGDLMNVGDKWYAEQHFFDEGKLVEVVVEELPADAVEGSNTHWGWIDRADTKEDGKETPVMIQSHWGVYSMQFPYSPRAEEEVGRGRTVLLRVTKKA